MRIEIKNWLGVVLLLCVGFILGKVTVLPDVNASPEESGVGRYQLVAGTRTNELTGERIQTVFRVDTKTGDVEYWQEWRQYFHGEEAKSMGGDTWVESMWRHCIEKEIVPDSIKADQEKKR